MPEGEGSSKIERLGKYEVIEEIGHGGMARVFLARDDETGEEVAVKVLLPELTVQRSFIQRFRREIETLRTLECPGVVAILDVGEEGRYHYYVMEYMDGASLEELLVKRRKFTAGEALKFARAVANTLQHAHAKGVIHRDIKPANIMTDSAGAIKLTDFGIAKDMEATRLTVTGGIVGTADYMSPEQAEGKRVTRKSDIYSLGVCLYEMLTARVPFTGKTYMDVIRAHRFNIPESPKLLNPAIPGKLAHLVESMMEKDPDKRPASAGEVIAQIDAIENVHASLSEEERQTARQMVTWALVPAADWKMVALKGAGALLLAGGLVLAAWGAKYRYFTTAAEKLQLGMAAFAGGEYDTAADYFGDVTYCHSGTTEAEEAEARMREIRYMRRRKIASTGAMGEKLDAASLLEHALVLLESGELEKAEELLGMVANDFPNSAAGVKAAEKLAELRGEETSTEDTPPAEAGS